MQFTWIFSRFSNIFLPGQIKKNHEEKLFKRNNIFHIFINIFTLIRHFCQESLTDLQEMFLSWLILPKIVRGFTISSMNSTNSMNFLLLNLPEKQRDCDLETAKYFSACCNLLYVWTLALYALRRFFKANLTCEIQSVLFTRITEVASVM